MKQICDLLDLQIKGLNALVDAGQLPSISRFGVWSAIVNHLMDRLVEGFSRVRECTQMGRGVMQLDLQMIYAHAAKLGPVVPSCLPRDKAHVDAYIKAFYLPNGESLMAWVQDNCAAYPLWQVHRILDHGLKHNITPPMDPRAEKRLATNIETLFCIPMGEEQRWNARVKAGASSVGNLLVQAGEALAKGGI